MTFPPAPALIRDPLARYPRLLWPVVAALIALVLVADCARVARADMAFLLYAAGQVLDGARLYRDVVEINPPLIVWLNLPVVALARALRASELIVYSVAVTVVVTALLVYAARVARRYALTDEPGLRAWFLLLSAVALFPLSRGDFGQREHLVLALLLPYLLLVVARLRPRPVPATEAAAIGLLGAVGLALKPHFLLVWIALELVKRWRRSLARWELTPEAASVLVGLGLYALAIRVLAPEYLEVVAVLGPAYARYLHAPFLELLVLSPGAALTLFSGLALLALRHRVRCPALVGALAAAMIGSFLAGAAQQKGLRYHFYPAFALGFLLIAILVHGLATGSLRLAERVYARVARALAITVALVATGATIVTAAGGRAAERRARAELFDLVDVVRARAGGRPVAVLSYHMESAFPLVNYAGVPLASRFPHLWLLPASYWDSLAAGGAVRFRPFADMAPAERWLNRAVREDLLKAEPRVLVVLRPARDVGPNGPRRMHYIRYFGRQPDLAAFFARYQLAGHYGEFDVYQRLEGAQGVATTPPSAEPAQLDVKGVDGQGVRLAFGDPEFALGAGVFLLTLGLGAILGRRGDRHGELAVAEPASRAGSPPG